jgi:DNA-binding transcriptional ArsR family regulator
MYPSEVIMIGTSKFSLKLSDIEKMDIPFGDEDAEFEPDKEQVKQLSPEVREILARDKVRRAVRKLGEDGLSIEEIIKITGLDRKTVLKHLDALEGLREVYSQKRNKKLTLYYPNGKPLHQIGKRRFDWGNPILEMYIAKGQKDKIFFYILEKKYTILDGEVSEGAIMLPIDHLEEFIEALRELKDKFQEITP